ncbi:Tellurite resistance protein TerB [Filimonas lacunae]|uniref:Tellurite resistance protein TerB n=1 Tax=Filimonas lacunae TaxID=477680 RepID=A0A173MK27_9BACT|nr:tellurite resistance TerB family protein [Filimonas lacunae]BAV07954.1 hypothetical protein FLA_3986 [Filimonas lacunae]SIT07096.1 Tellurite resistance protein TerB [Filimonas lacunae]
MGLLSNIFKKQPAQPVNYTPLNVQDAWVGIITAMGRVDGSLSDVEIDNLARSLVMSSIFDGHDIVDYINKAATFQNTNGSQQVIDDCVPHIPQHDRATLLCIVTEVVLADGQIDANEKELLIYLAGKLGIEPALFQQILEVYLIRNKYSKVIFD